VATLSRLLEIIGLFCRISSLSQGSFAKETYNFKEPTNRRHPIHAIRSVMSFDVKQMYMILQGGEPCSHPVIQIGEDPYGALSS